MRNRFLTIFAALWLLGLPAGADPTNGTHPTPGPSQTAKKEPTIFDYKQEIGMTTDQENKMKALLKDLQTNMSKGEKRLDGMEAEYRQMLEKEPTIEQARAKLQEIANATVDLRLIDLQTSRRITGVLSPDQLRKWHAIQARLRAGGK